MTAEDKSEITIQEAILKAFEIGHAVALSTHDLPPKEPIYPGENLDACDVALQLHSDVETYAQLKCKEAERWKVRCGLAEKYISETPCDPDTSKDQWKAYQDWMGNIANPKES